MPEPRAAPRMASLPPGRRPRPSVLLAAIVLVVLLAVPSLSAVGSFPRPAGPTGSLVHPSVGAPSIREGGALRSDASPVASAGNWTNLTGSSGSPPPVVAPAGLTFDSTDGYLLMFGGTSIGPSGQAVGETWRLSAGHWENLTGALSVSPPPRREGAVLVNDPGAGGVVLFGGLGAAGYLGDTWVFSGGAWTSPASAVSGAPSPRDAAAASYDPSTSSVILFGGLDASGARSDTYSFANGSWTAITPKGAVPPAACCPSMVFDGNGGYLLALLSPSNSGPTQTWTFDGQSWANVTSGPAPTPRQAAAFAYDPALAAPFLFGGESPAGAALNDSWTYSSVGWSPSQSPLSALPSPRWDAGFAANGSGASSCLILFGGFDRAGMLSRDRGETWGLCGRTTSGSVGTPIASELALNLSVSRSVGTVPFQVTIVTQATGGAGPYNLSVCPGTGRCEQSLDWDGSSYTSSVLISTPGTYTVSSVVTDTSGASRAETAAVRALAYTPLETTFTFSPLSGSFPLPVTFQVGASGGVAPYTIQWNFGDGTNGSSVSGVAVQHTYTRAGSFLPTLTVTDLTGRSLNRTLPLVTVTPGGASSPTGIPSAGFLALAAGASAASIAVAGYGAVRYRRQLRRSSTRLADDLWAGRGGPPEEEP